MKPKPQQLDAMTATIQNLRRLPDGERKQGLIEAAVETLKANEARGEISASTRALMIKLLHDTPAQPNPEP